MLGLGPTDDLRNQCLPGVEGDPGLWLLADFALPPVDRPDRGKVVTTGTKMVVHKAAHETRQPLGIRPGDDDLTQVTGHGATPPRVLDHLARGRALACSCRSMRSSTNN